MNTRFWSRSASIRSPVDDSPSMLPSWLSGVGFELCSTVLQDGLEFTHRAHDEVGAVRSSESISGTADDFIACSWRVVY
jgi:hypothetical protein